MSTPNAEQLARVYTKIRDKRRDLSKQDDALKEQLDIVSQQLLDICKEQGASTIRTEYGTVSRRLTKNFWTTDWASFYQFIKEHDLFNLMQQRINSTNMAQFLEENPDLCPPGLNADMTQTVVITKR
jgi:uncharacterized membrane protein YgaE (UPF0421/DUF939 family)